ncbi:MAG: ATP-binding cassette domain-containing protein [Oscillochloris sp.]|nr:ATP-binding cassette domain-containing protein [Oscillochloris sp.]
MFTRTRQSEARPAGGTYRHGNDHLIELREVVKTFQTAAGSFTALKSVSIKVNSGEFVAVIGKSGSGKSTMINMITGIDRPSSGEILVGDAALHTLREGQMAVWRGQNLGIIFQFFQLLPTLSLVENVMLPMDFRRTFPPHERRRRAMELLDQVEMADQAHKLPSAISGGQQQRVAIARALANDPPILIADEPTGNLDSRTAKAVFSLFEQLVANGKTILMVTHDPDLARRATRSLLVADGEVVNEYIIRALPRLGFEQLGWVQAHVEVRHYAPGETLVRAGDPADGFYIITGGEAEVWLPQPGAPELLADQLVSGQFFGELGLLNGGRRRATVRAGAGAGVDVVILDPNEFSELLSGSEATRNEIDHIARLRADGQEAAHG